MQRESSESVLWEKASKLAPKMEKLLRIVIAPIFHFVMLSLKFSGNATYQTLIHFANHANLNLTEDHPSKKPAQSQRLQLGIICKKEKTDVEKLTVCFYSSHVDTQQLMLSFSGHIIWFVNNSSHKSPNEAPCAPWPHAKILYSCFSTLKKITFPVCSDF